MEYEQIPSFPKSQKFQIERMLSVLFLRKMWPLFVQVSGEINVVPEKTHSQNPGYLPAREEGAGVAPTASPTRWGLTLFSTEMVFMCHLFFFFSIESFLSFCSPSCLIESLSLYLQLPCSQSSLFPRGDTESDFSLQLSPLSVTGGPGSLCYFFFCDIPRQKRASLTFGLL